MSLLTFLNYHKFMFIYINIASVWFNCQEKIISLIPYFVTNLNTIPGGIL
jgi:hypothetical protein